MEKSQIAELVKDYQAAHIPQETIDSIVEQLRHTPKNNIGSTVDLTSFIFYLQVDVKNDDGATGRGHGGGVSSPGAGVSKGNLSCDDLEVLYGKTVSFQLTTTPTYTSLLFFDGSSKLLAHYDGGSVSTILGVFGGKFNWSVPNKSENDLN